MRLTPLLGLMLLLLVACTPTATDDGVPPQTCPSTIVIRDFAFSPSSCAVQAGTTLSFVNEDSEPHTATSDPGTPLAFDTGTLQQGQSAQVAFTETGEYPYFCAIHPTMRATIIVRATSTAPQREDDAAY